MIPKVIHQYWTDPTGKNLALPSDMQVNVDSWKKYHPDYEQIIWSNDGIEKLLIDFHGLNVFNCIQSSKFPAMQSDIVRLALVYEFGGIWSDLKNIVLESFLDNIVLNETVVVVEHPPSAERPDPTNYLCNAFLAAPAKDPIIFECLKNACENINKRAPMDVFSITGPALLMRIIHRLNGKYEYIVLRHSDTWGKLMKRTSASCSKSRHSHAASGRT